MIARKTRKEAKIHAARIRRVVNGKEYVSVLVRETYREGCHVRHRTLASLTKLPPHVIEAVERALTQGERPGGSVLQIDRSLPHGHVAAVLGTMRNWV